MVYRDFVIPKRRQGLYLVYKRYILPIGSLYATYHLLQEPEKSVDPWEKRGNTLKGPKPHLFGWKYMFSRIGFWEVMRIICIYVYTLKIGNS